LEDRRRLKVEKVFDVEGITDPPAERKSLDGLFSELPLPPGKVLRRLLDRHGVPWDALYNIKKGWVRWDDGGFDWKAGGTPALILPCRDRGEIIDLAAWGSNWLATWKQTLSPAFCVGDLEEIFNPATFFAGAGLLIHRGPLDWLRAGCAGIVVLRPELCWPYLRNVARVICTDEGVAELVHKHNRPAPSSTKIFVTSHLEKAFSA
jgi:hypothetical protein